MDQATKRAIKHCQTFVELLPHLRSLPQAPDARTVELCGRVLERFSHEAELRIAYLGNHTLEPLPRYVALACGRHGRLVAHHLGQYNQYFQAVLDPESGLHGFKPHLIFLSLSLRGLAPDIRARFLELTPEERRAELNRIIDHVGQWVAAARQHTDAVLLVANFPRPAHAQAGIADGQLEMGESEFYAELNLALQRLLRQDSRAFVYDLDQVLARCGRHAAHDAKLYYLARMEWSEAALPHLAAELHRHIRALRGDARKCLVLDLDNTLWGGVVGEEGVDGIKIGPGDPAGEAFMTFQQALRALKARGVILALCSKNNPEDVREVFARREMPLCWEDFAVTRVNWQHKHENLREIARLLNIGTDSLVFMDDNPVECELVRRMMPEVHTVCLPGDPAAYVDCLQALDEFEKVALTDEDRHKSEQYRQNARRAEVQREAEDLNAFLESLGTRLELFTAGPEHLARVHQLFTKTNQFNLTTRRYTQAEIERFQSEPAWQLRLASVRDNFGDLGIVGLYLVENKGSSVAIDSFILSCRALGRGIETAMMNQIKRDYLLSGRFESLEAMFIPTAKNRPADDFYDKQGFARAGDLDGGGRLYRLTRAEARLLACPGIEVLCEGRPLQDGGESRASQKRQLAEG